MRAGANLPASGDPCMPASPAEVASAFVAAINAADLTALRALMTDDHTFTDARGMTFSGADKMIAGWQYFFRAYPDYWNRKFTWKRRSPLTYSHPSRPPLLLNVRGHSSGRRHRCLGPAEDAVAVFRFVSA